MADEFEYFTPLSPQECAERLSAAIEVQAAGLIARPFNIPTADIIRGTVKSDHIELWHSKGSGDTPTVLSATLQASDGGTLVSGGFHRPKFTRVFGVVFRTLACLFGIIPTVLVLYAASHRTLSNHAMVLVVPVIFLGGAFILVAISGFILRIRPEVLMKFLHTHLGVEYTT